MTKEEIKAFWDKEHERISKESGVNSYIVGFIRSRLIRHPELTIKDLVVELEEKIRPSDRHLNFLTKAIARRDEEIAKLKESEKKENLKLERVIKKRKNAMEQHGFITQKIKALKGTIKGLEEVTDDQLKVILQEVKI